MKRYTTFLVSVMVILFCQRCTQKISNTSRSSDSPTDNPLEFTCKQLVVTDYDRVSGSTKSGTKKSLIVSQDGGKTGYIIDLYLIKGVLALSIQAAGAGECIGEDDQIRVLFRDESSIELPNNGDFNCESDFAIYFGGLFGNKDHLNDFSSKEIKNLRLTTSEGSLEKSFTQSQSIQLMRTFECMQEKLKENY